jgi:hypothetical protein
VDNVRNEEAHAEKFAILWCRVTKATSHNLVLQGPRRATQLASVLSTNYMLSLGQTWSVIDFFFPALSGAGVRQLRLKEQDRPELYIYELVKLIDLGCPDESDKILLAAS